MKPFAEACDRNREPILAVLREHLADSRHVLEIASGTGQHAVFFARELPHLCWQTSDLAENHRGIQAWIDDSGLSNVLPPLLLDANAGQWPELSFDAVFCANAVHIMSWLAVQRLFVHLASVLAEGGLLCLYGPFNYQGRYSSESNARFDGWLRARNPESGIRDFEAVDALAAARGLQLRDDVAMPANNRLLIWRMARTGSAG